MYQFFVREDQVSGDEVMLSGADAHHLKDVVRVKTGERVRISTDSGENYLCEYEGGEADSAILRIIDRAASTTELPFHIYLFQGFPKKDRFENIIEKTVELGVYEIVPVAMRFCVAKLEGSKASGKLERYGAKAMAAAKQAKRSVVPQVREILSFDEAVRMAETMDMVIVPYENAAGMGGIRELMAETDALAGKDIAVFIGPEGGFAPEEIEGLRELNNSRVISLGQRILRTDTAAILAVGMLGLVGE